MIITGRNWPQILFSYRRNVIGINIMGCFRFVFRSLLFGHLLNDLYRVLYVVCCDGSDDLS